MGVIAGIVVVLAVIAVVIGVLVFFVQRHHAIQSRVQQSLANYPSIANPSSSSQEGRRESEESGGANSNSDSPGVSCADGSFSDLVSYHSDVESSYPVSSGRYSSARESVRSKLSGIENLAFIGGSKGSVTSDNSSRCPSVRYVSTINVKDGAKRDGDTMSVKERVKIFNLRGQREAEADAERKVSNSSSEEGGVASKRLSNGVVSGGAGAACNDCVPHRKEDELTVTRIGIRDRTSSEITISTIRQQVLRQRLMEKMKMRVKSEDDVNVKTSQCCEHVSPLMKSRFTVGDNGNRDSVVTISTVSSQNRSMSDVTISTLSRNSVFVASNGHSPRGSGEINHHHGYAHDNGDRFSNATLSTVLSGDRAEDSDSVFTNTEDSEGRGSWINPAFNPDGPPTHYVPNGQASITTNGVTYPSKVIPASNGIEQRHQRHVGSHRPHNVHRTESVQSRTSEVSCSHNHENHRRRFLAGVTGNAASHATVGGASIHTSGVRTSGVAAAVPRPRNMSSSSDTSVSSTGCSECDSCPYCRDATSVLSADAANANAAETNNNNGGGAKYVSVVNTEKSAVSFIT